MRDVGNPLACGIVRLFVEIGHSGRDLGLFCLETDDDFGLWP